MQDIKRKLDHAVTAFDRKQEERAAKRGSYHNPYALGQYLMRVDDVMSDIANGATPQAAIIAGFGAGPLRNACLKAIGAAASNVDASGSYLGLPVYKPASAKR
jgi:hypothetical protein